MTTELQVQSRHPLAVVSQTGPAEITQIGTRPHGGGPGGGVRVCSRTSSTPAAPAKEAAVAYFDSPQASRSAAQQPPST
jgi:hypothetical protein